MPIRDRPDYIFVPESRACAPRWQSAAPDFQRQDALLCTRILLVEYAGAGHGYNTYPVALLRLNFSQSRIARPDFGPVAIRISWRSPVQFWPAHTAAGNRGLQFSVSDDLIRQGSGARRINAHSRPSMRSIGVFSRQQRTRRVLPGARYPGLACCGKAGPCCSTRRCVGLSSARPMGRG